MKIESKLKCDDCVKHDVCRYSQIQTDIQVLLNNEILKNAKFQETPIVIYTQCKKFVNKSVASIPGKTEICWSPGVGIDEK